MRFLWTHVPSLMALMAVTLVTLGGAPCAAQTRITSHEELRRELAVGDVVTLMPTPGPPVRGRLRRIGDVDLDVRPDARTRRDRGNRDVTVRFDAIQYLERPRDSTRNGAALGAGIGAAIGGAFFLYALAVDRNEIDEWAGIYVGVSGLCTGAGSLIGWAVDRAHSKPHLTFAPSSTAGTSVRIGTVLGRSRGIALVIAF
jgi:hypothetical protein